jgi:hypothetical protein
LSWGKFVGAFTVHDLRFVEEQLCSIVIEFLFEAKQNKTMCLVANLSWHLLKHFLNIKQYSTHIDLMRNSLFYVDPK